MDTRESYDILVIEKLNSKILFQDRSESVWKCMQWLLAYRLIFRKFCELSKIKKKIEKLKDAKMIAMARRDAAGPSAEDISLPAEVQVRLKQEDRNNGSRINYSRGYCDSYYTRAVACGFCLWRWVYFGLRRW